MVIIGVFAAVAFVGMAANMYDSIKGRYVSDLTGMFIRARTAATAEQTQTWVQLSVQSSEVMAQLWWLDPVVTNSTYGAPVLLDNIAISEYDGNRAGDGEGYGNRPLCIYPIEVGIRPPSQGAAVAKGSGCLTDTTRVVFMPSGELRMEVSGAQVPLNGAGIVVPVIDQRVPTARRASLIQLFPAGMIRTSEVKYD